MSVIDISTKALSVLELAFTVYLVGAIWLRTSSFARALCALIVGEFLAWLRYSPLRDWRLWCIVAGVANVASQWSPLWLRATLFGIEVICTAVGILMIHRAYRIWKQRIQGGQRW